jgi:hypothetical protein
MPKKSSKSKMSQQQSKMLLLSMLATANLVDDVDAWKWADSVPYSVSNFLGIKRELMIHPNNVMKSLRNTPDDPSLHRLQGRTLTQSNINSLSKNGRNASVRKRQPSKKTKKQYGKK